MTVTALSGDDAAAVLDRQAAVMETMASDAPLPLVLDSIVTALEELMPASRCSVLLLDDAGQLRHGSAPSLPAAYSAAIDGLEPGPLAGSCGSAVHLGDAVIVADVHVDERWDDFIDLAIEHGLRACWSSPIRCGSDIVGTFAVYHGDPYDPGGRDRELVRRFTHLASLAVTHDRAIAERDARREAELGRQSAERANLAKSQFVTALSHELRTPLQAITGFAENLLTLDLTPDRRREALDRIGLATSHILSIVDDVLDLARVEAGAMPIEECDFDLADAITESIALIQPIADRNEVMIEHVVGERAVVSADRRRLQQVVLNLLANAVRFSPAGRNVRVVSEIDGGAVTMRVVDQGPGIPDDLLDRLFVPFDRLGADAGREGGAGLGLVLARRLTEAMGATLDLQSTVGVGTDVSLTFPLAGCHIVPVPERDTGR